MKLSTACVLSVMVMAAMLMTVASGKEDDPRHVFYNRKKIPSEWNFAGFPSGSDKFTFIVALKQRNVDKLEKLFWDVSTPGRPEYRKFRSVEEIHAMVSPPKIHHDFVVRHFSKAGVKVESRGDSLACSTTVAVAEKLFKTKLYSFTHEQKQKVTIVRQMGEYSLPKRLMNYVEFVAGLSEFPMIKSRIRRPRHNNDQVGATDADVVPQTLNYIYNVPAGTTASNTSQGVIEFGSGEYYAAADLQTFAKDMNLTIAPLESSHIVNPLPPAGVEGTLDIEYISATGAGSSNWYWTETNWLYDWSSTFAAATQVPQVVSISYGWAEYDQCSVSDECQQLGVNSQQYVVRVNTEFQKIGLRGVSLLCASGDSGAHGRTDPDCSDKKTRPDFPAASPYITSVGATELENPQTSLPNAPAICSTQYKCASGGTETAVSYALSFFTSGGGFSNVAARPSYQDDAVNAYLQSGSPLPPTGDYNTTGRGYPDIAANGHNFLIYEKNEGGIIAVGGTSASSPTVAGFMSLLNQVVVGKTGAPLGFLNPFLYKMYADHPTAFRDITVGDNKCTEDFCNKSVCTGYECAKGWDPVTGLGVPNVSEMLNYVNSQF